MKKILIALALLASVQIAGAQQVKSVNAARAGVDKALKTVSDAKKAANAANWTKLGQAYIDAYLAPQGNGWIGASEADLNLLMSQEKVLGTREEVLSGQNYLVKKYATADYYFNTAGSATARCARCRPRRDGWFQTGNVSAPLAPAGRTVEPR